MAKVKKIYDTIHGFIPISENIQKIIDTPEFQRLRDLKQLGATNYVFPSATHTRFEHSIAVSYLGKTMIENIKKNQPELNISQRDIDLIEIAGLIHDIGHGPFSHLWDNYIISKEEKDHEERGCEIFKNMIKKYKLGISEEEFGTICEIINPSKKNVNKWYYQIIANKQCQLDVDKIDYIQRDSFYIGEIGQNNNFKRLITDVRVVETKEKTHELAWCYKLNYEIFSLFTTRYRLHKSVYTHHAVKSHEYIIIDILNNLHDLLLKGKVDFIDLTDSVVFCKLCAIKSSATKRLMSRDIPSFIGEIVIPKNYENKNFLKEPFPKRIANIIIDKIQIKFSSSNYNPMNKIYYYNCCKVEKIKPTWCNVEFNETILRCYNNAGKKNTEETKHISNDEIIAFWDNYLKELGLQ
uniref:HD domain-containing protein n=1 Tax=viral metagenome TaxID=1070528 RepID=A0A6C0FCA3_9ZZZZ|tara:strand:- start:5607 stop:6833 length:1227 start_codon:yes stop_codon:yes gene_type:complete